MSSTSSAPGSNLDAELGLNVDRLTKSATNGIRVAFGIAGVAALVLGIVLLVQPAKTLTALAVLVGIYFLISGIVRLAIGIFSRGMSTGLRVLDILFGVLLVVGGVIALKNLTLATSVLLIMVAAIVGIGWIIEGILAITESRGAESPVWAVIFGVISILAGIAVLAVPGWSVLWLILFTSILLIVLGIISLVRAFTFGREALKRRA